MTSEKLFDIWSKRNPRFEKRYENNIIKLLTDYGKGSNSLQESRGKIFGAGYEVYIIAFFIGLYADRRKILVDNNEKTKIFGQPIMFWGNKEIKGQRKQYNIIQKHIFVSLIARSDIDLIALDKEEITPRKACDILIKTMEEYANYGFYYIEDKLLDDSLYFFRNTAFLDIFLSLHNNEADNEANIDVEPLD